MDSRRAAPTLGIVASLFVLAVLAVPYLIVDAADVSTYYGAGVLTPWAAGLVALLAVVVFAAGREGRTDPETAAGAGLVFGIFAFAVALLWAVTVPAELPLQLTADEPWIGPLTTGTILEYHRWILVVGTVLPVVAGAWYARSLRLF